jgi:DNA-binding transcriptional MerR regulator
MTSTLAIGEFARLTYLSVPTLRHYHEVGVLEPAIVDPASGYRRYAVDQVATAHLVRRLRELQMPLPDIRSVVGAPDDATRNRLIGAHLEHMERQLGQTRTVIASLRALLTGGTVPDPAEVSEVRDLPSSTVLAISDAIRWDDMGGWFEKSFGELSDALGARGIEPAGPPGGLYWPTYFEQHEGPVSVYVPLPVGAEGEFGSGARARPLEIPATRCVVRQHRGPYEDLDITYGAVGVAVIGHHVEADGPIREIYLVGPGDGVEPAEFRTEVCFPINAASSTPPVPSQKGLR